MRTVNAALLVLIELSVRVCVCLRVCVHTGNAALLVELVERMSREIMPRMTQRQEGEAR